MPALATIADLRNVMERALGQDDNRRAPQLLDIASQRVRTFTGQHFTAETTTDRVRVRNGKARLSQSPVTAVTAVRDMNGNDVAYEWFAGQVVDCNPTLLNAFEVNLRRTRLQYVDITNTHGYETIPADVVGIVCDMVATALDSPPETIGVQSETVGPFSVANSAQFAGGVRLTQTMRDALMNYTSPAGTANVS